jgi:DNA polymerase III alpha subunit (gram-positive type)
MTRDRVESKQSKIDSAMEVVTNTAIGFAFAIVGNQIILPAVLGIRLHAGSNVLIACGFTVISLIRQYLLRRWFNGRPVWSTIKERFA